MSLREIANALRAARMNLTPAQAAGRACVHCGQPFGGLTRSEPYVRAARQCAGHCRICVADGLHAAFAARITPARRPFIQWVPLGGIGPLDARVAVSDGRRRAISAPVRSQDAGLLAEQAARLKCSAEVRKSSSEREAQG